MTVIYIPENLDLPELLSSHPKYSFLTKKVHLDKLHYFINLIYQQKILYRIHGYVPLKASYLKNLLNNYKLYRAVLEDCKVIECDNFYIKTEKSYGYRLLPPYSCSFHKSIEIKSSCFKASIKRWTDSRLPKTKIHKHLYNFLKQININYDVAKIEIDALQDINQINNSRISIEQFINKDFYLIKDNYGRVHTNLTNLKSNLRKHLSFNNSKLVNIDISNSQPLLILLLFFKYNLSKLLLVNNSLPSPPPSPLRFDNSLNTSPDMELYSQLVQSGTLYDYLSNYLKVSKDQFKKALFEKVFFGKRISKTFSTLFPNISNFIRKVKRRDYRKLAWMMQRMESKIIISKICGRIMREHPNLFISTIHDSIMTVPEGVEIVKTTMIEEFNKLGISPKIKING